MAAQEDVGRISKEMGQSRREFVKSLCGAAATILAFNRVWSAMGSRGGIFSIPDAAAYEAEAATATLSGDEVIIDMQTHCVDPSGVWAKGDDGKQWMRNLTQVFGQASKCEYDQLGCYAAEQMFKEVFLDSDTAVAVISALWGERGHNPTPTRYASEARNLIREKIGKGRGLIHGGVLPNEPGQIEFMEVQARDYQVDAWKLYPQWGPEGEGFFMDDPRYGLPMLEKARELGVKIVCAHRGLPLPNLAYKYSRPEDIVRVGRRFPDLTFVCYHAGFEPGIEEGPYDPGGNKGVDRLIKAYKAEGYGPNEGNVYAELGSCWRYYMSKPEQAAHLMGKLLKYMGEDRICWGTDAIWYGSPQDQIQMFRAFEITEAFQEKYGYPALTAEAKRKIFGMNAAAIHGIDMDKLKAASTGDEIGVMRRAYAGRNNPTFRTYGPKTGKAFEAFIRRKGGRPA
jgi:predicted TIM-barrel fold metal-dependent hydrolase